MAKWWDRGVRVVILGDTKGHVEQIPRSPCSGHESNKEVKKRKTQNRASEQIR